MQPLAQPLPSSFRDPSGFMFEKEGMLYRQVNLVFKEHLDHFMDSGCYAYLTSKGFLVPHREVNTSFFDSVEWYKTLQPDLIPFISYPYEWSFDMLRDAALHTLQMVKESIPFGIVLKDASPYNIQWFNGKPVFIDTLSFEKYNEEAPWIAYRQFCECFLAPLLLMHYTQQPLQAMLLAYPDGIPLPVAASLLPLRSKFSLHPYLHIHLHSRLSRKPEQQAVQTSHFSRKKLEQLLAGLESLVKSLHWKGRSSVWENYYDEASKRKDYLTTKKDIVKKWLDGLPRLSATVDLGANEGEFSLLAAGSNMKTLSTDFDHASINRLYLKIKKENIMNIQPLIVDLSNPTPSIGLNNRERISFIERTRADLGLALALVHHLCIGKNIPFEKVVELFAQMANYLIVEFVPKNDAKIQLMLRHKKDIYHYYTEENFVTAFERSFSIIHRQEIEQSGRILFLMKKHA